MLGLSSWLATSGPVAQVVGIFSCTGIIMLPIFGIDQRRIFNLYSQIRIPEKNITNEKIDNFLIIFFS